MIGILNSLCKTVDDDHKLLFGDDDDPGLKGKVSVLMKANDSVTKWKWIVISAASSSLVGGLIAWAIISRLPQPFVAFGIESPKEVSPKKETLSVERESVHQSVEINLIDNYLIIDML